jgi:hypothetical protein
MISNLEETDIISLGLTTRNLWPFVLQQVLDSAQVGGPLAGLRLACCSTNAPDLPEKFAEDKLLKDAIIDNLREEEDAYSPNG